MHIATHTLNNWDLILFPQSHSKFGSTLFRPQGISVPVNNQEIMEEETSNANLYTFFRLSSCRSCWMILICNHKPFTYFILRYIPMYNVSPTINRAAGQVISQVVRSASFISVIQSNKYFFKCLIT